MASFVLITAARNEELYIRKTIEAVTAQTVLPDRWIIVSDGSTDHTDEIVNECTANHRFIELVKLALSPIREFSRQVVAVKVGYERVKARKFDFVGNLDADISFGNTYYQNILLKCEAEPQLGIAGGMILDKKDQEFRPRFGNSVEHVAGAIQFFRRQCYEDIGGYVSLKYGGYDAVAIEMAQMKGWKVEAFPELKVLHHRPTGTAGINAWGSMLREGYRDYYIGYHPIYELGKCVRRAALKPYLLGSILAMTGFLSLMLHGVKPDLPPNYVKYLHGTQLRKVKTALKLISGLKTGNTGLKANF